MGLLHGDVIFNLALLLGGLEACAPCLFFPKFSEGGVRMTRTVRVALCLLEWLATIGFTA